MNQFLCFSDVITCKNFTGSLHRVPGTLRVGAHSKRLKEIEQIYV